jgi:hypothetical protein
MAAELPLFISATSPKRIASGTTHALHEKRRHRKSNMR